MYARVCLLFAGILVITSFKSIAQRQMEKLDRGGIAVLTDNNSVFISWRLLGNDPENIGFNVYKIINNADTIKINRNVLLSTTNYIDNEFDISNQITYFVKSVIDGR